MSDDAKIILGRDREQASVHCDLAQIAVGRLLVQGNSGAGKSWLLRRLLEQSWGRIQQIVIDPDGEFASLAERFDHVVLGAASIERAGASALAASAHEHRYSAVLDLSEVERDRQVVIVADFIAGLLDAPREHWTPALVVIDEAQLFAPWGFGADEDRRRSVTMVTDLMGRGRKRGLAGVIATRRLARLAKSVAAEAANVLIGRNALDIDANRAADLLGIARKKAHAAFGTLKPGEFIAFGPALTPAPKRFKVGEVETTHRGAAPALDVLPALSADEARELVASLPDAPEGAPSNDGARGARSAREDAWTDEEIAILKAGYAANKTRAEKMRLSFQRSARVPNGQKPVRASLRQVLSFLAQEGVVVIEKPKGGFIVDGRYSYDAAGIVGLANKRRGCKRLPNFAVHMEAKS